MVQNLTALDVIAINIGLMEQSGGVSQTRDEGLLESAVMRPQTAAYYEEADLITQIGLLIVGIALTHAFIDGNKRTALLAGAVFAQINGYWIESGPLEFGRQVEAVVVHEDGLEAATARLIAWLRDHVVLLSGANL